MDDTRGDSQDRPGEVPISESSPQLSLWPAGGEPAALVSPSGTSASAPPPALDPPWTLKDLFAFILFGVFTFVSANLLAILIFSLLHDRFFPGMSVTQAFAKTPWVVAMQTGWELLWLA